MFDQVLIIEYLSKYVCSHSKGVYPCDCFPVIEELKQLGII